MKVDEYHMKKDEHNTKRYYCHTKKKHLFNGVTKHECGWIPHESGLKQHDTVKIRGLPHGKIEFKKCALKNSHKNGLPTVF